MTVLTTYDIGCAIVTLDKAYLFTDGRYFLQAGKQLDEYVDRHLLGETLAEYDAVIGH